jgi:phosphatidylserine/phosphatidylglycerophosphate/cardiolipin synthase-like enzyme
MNFLNKLYKTDKSYCLTIGKDCCCKSSTILIDSINSAKIEIFACVYKLNNETIVTALEQALYRGVNIYIIADYKKNENSKFMHQLVKSGAQVLFWNKQEKLHAKFTIIDDNHVLTGSFNWTISKRHKVDLIISLYDDTSIANFKSLFNELKSIC